MSDKHTKLGAHVLRGAEGLGDFIAAGAAVVKLVGDWGMAQTIPKTTLVIGRKFEHHYDAQLQRNSGKTPSEAAKQFFDDQIKEYKFNPAIIYWEGHNEPVWNSNDEMAWYAELEVERMKLMANEGLKCVIGNFATGSPNLELWPAFFPAFKAALQYEAILGLHEYSCPWMWWMTGTHQLNKGEDEGDTGWTTLRYRKIYRQHLIPNGFGNVPLVMTECGIDPLVSPKPPEVGTGGTWQQLGGFWKRHSGESDRADYYYRQLVWYDEEMQKDDYVVGGTIFTWGNFGGAWKHFEVAGTPVAEKLIAYAKLNPAKPFVYDVSKSSSEPGVPTKPPTKPRKPAPSDVTRVEVVSPEVGYLRIRSTPATNRPPIAQVNDGDTMDSLESDASTQAKVGRQGQWLRVRTPNGVEGYTAAWYLRLADDRVAEKPSTPPVSTGTSTARVVVDSDIGLNIRQGTGTNTPITWHVVDKTVLDVLKDPAQAAAKVGQDAWIKIRTPSLHEGYVSGMYVQREKLADKRKAVNPASVPPGESAWIFGIHGAGATTPVNFQHLFKDKNKTGWVLFTEAIGDNPNHGGGHDYSSWSDAGYGVIVRLNNGYEPAGTLPVSAKYPDFAKACARYVQNSKGCKVWIVGNEQNNVREHPGGADKPIEHITPQLYAKAFNMARQRIKAVDHKARVVLGAVDPYNTYPWSKMGGKRNIPLEYFKEMLANVDDLDGISLHTYTHWMDPKLITSKMAFNDAFLQPGTPKEHYYDFYAYRPFAEAIPAKWRDRPIYITESNHWLALDHRPNNSNEERKIGWVNKDTGWVQAAYAEIDRWNNTPHAPQIRCLLLYRWTGDAWAIEKHGEIHKDLRKALNHDYRWRQ